jgi:sugar phosphate isomerase/epimerase
MRTPRLIKSFSSVRALGLSLILLLGGAALPAIAQEATGIQLWSVRDQAKADLDKALDLVAGWKFKEVETAGTYGLSAEAFAQKLKQHHLKAVSAHYGYDRLTTDLSGVIAEAKTLGVKSVVCPILPHKDRKFDADYAHEVAKKFNEFGRAFKAAGIRFGYHTHGFEFVPVPGSTTETSFDILVKETEPELVTFEMDVFWVWITGTKPEQLLERYPHRWSLVHLKDIRKGVELGGLSGSAPATDNVAVGSGQIPWATLIPLFKKVGVEHFFIEDETTDPVQNIPVSLAYLKSLKK